MTNKDKGTASAGGVFGTELVELVLQRESGATAFAVSREGQVTIEQAYETPGGGRLLPIPASNNLLRHGVILLPESVEDYASLGALRDTITAFITRYVSLPPGFLPLAVHYVLLSWVYDEFNEVPYLRFLGDYGSGKTRALQVIGAPLYRPLIANGATTISPIFYGLDLFRGALVLDEADFRRSDERADIAKILNNGNQRGFPVLRSVMTPQKTYDPQAFHVFGPKLLAMRGNFADLAIESRCLTARMDGVTPEKHIPITLPASFETEAMTIRNQLLAWRFLVRPILPLTPLPLSPSLSLRANQMLAPLLALADDDDTRAGFVSFMAADERQRQSIRLEDVACFVFEALASERKAGRVDVPVSALRAHLLRHSGSEFERPPTARFVGSALRGRFGLSTFKSHGVYKVHFPSGEAWERLAARFGGPDG